MGNEGAVDGVSFVPVTGDWRVPMVTGSEEEGWRGVCHPVVAWRVSSHWDHADPVYPFPQLYFDVEDGDVIGDPHRAEELCCDYGMAMDRLEQLLGGERIGERPMCGGMRKTLMDARVRAAMARRRAEA